MVEVNLNIEDFLMILKWYTTIYGKAEKKPNDNELRLLSKIETMRDAILEEEELLKD